MDYADPIRYGEVLIGKKDLCHIRERYKSYNNYRIRIIKYNTHIYYYDMVNGEVVEIKELK